MSSVACVRPGRTPDGAEVSPTPDPSTALPADDGFDSGLAEPETRVVIPEGELLASPPAQTVDEERELSLLIPAVPNARVFALGLPPGATFDERTRRLSFRPDSIQGGRSWTVTLEARLATKRSTGQLAITVRDTIRPPAPVVVETTAMASWDVHKVEQRIDAWLDSPGYAGQSPPRFFVAKIGVPRAASATRLFPVSIELHSAPNGGSDPRTMDPGYVDGTAQFVIKPVEPTVNWWTGFAEQLPGPAPTGGRMQNYTQRRILHLLEWLARTYPGVDLDRVRVSGSSMGGTGSMFLAIRGGRHLAGISSRIGATTSSRLSMHLQPYWGAVSLAIPDDLGMSAWARYDATRAAAEPGELHDVFLESANGKDDTVILFDHVVAPSPITGRSYVQAAQAHRLGHRIVWDLRAHGGSDPALVADWWGKLPPESELRRDKPFPAFSRCSTDDDPGAPNPAGGYTGVPRGVINRYLRWQTAGIVDTIDRLELPLRVDINTAAPAPAAGMPEAGNAYHGPLPIRADVTPRRVRAFRVLPGEQIRWSYGNQSGVVAANDDGTVTVPQLAFATSFTSLVLTRL